MLPISDGIVNGETFRGPRSAITLSCVSKVYIPPMPEPIITPTRSPSSFVHIDSRIRARLLRRNETEMRVAIVSPRLLRIHVLRRIPIAHLGADLTRKLRWIEKRHSLTPATAGHQARPERFNIVADRRDHTEAGHHDATGRRRVSMSDTGTVDRQKTKRRSARNFREEIGRTPKFIECALRTGRPWP